MTRRHYLFIKYLTLLNLLVLLLISIGCSNDSSDGEEVPKETPDTINPEISCPANIAETIDAFTTEKVVNYTAPVGTDNLPGVTTTQTAGLPSGSSFPIGTTTNTFEVKDAAGNKATCSFDITIVQDAPSESMPFFVNENPTPDGKTWNKIENLSDEFSGDTFDNSKWQNTDSNRWVGRPPGIFKENTVTQSDGTLKLTAYKLDAPETVNGNTFTHAGSNIYSKNSATVGTYIECKMKANKTFMSSTFWLINRRSAGTGCDVRVTELDIQECVGYINTTANWAQSFDASIHSNTHSRQTSCDETPTGSEGNDAPLGSKVYDDYHVYGCWWKSATEVEVYLDGKKVYTITPKANFDLPMELRMVVETYDWNPVPSDGGMTGSEADRTTYYDWVRTWELQ